MLLTSGSEGIRRWRLKPDHIVPDGPPEILLKSYSERMSMVDSRNLLAADQGLQHTVLISTDSPAELRTVSAHPGLDHAVLSPDGKWLVTSTWQGKGIRIWSTENLELVQELEPETGSASIAFSPQGDKLIVSSASAYCLYQVGSWARIWQRERDSDDLWPGPVTFSPDGQLLAVSHNRRLIHLLEAASGRPRLLLESRRPTIYSSFEFRRDGLQLAAAARQDVQVWDLGGMQEQLRKLNLALELAESVRLRDVSRSRKDP